MAAALGVAVSAETGEAPRAVTVVEVGRQPLPASDIYVANVVSRNAVEVSTKLAGRILRITVDEGARVREGQLLVEIDASEAESAYQQARAALASARVALQNARREHERFKALVADDAAPRRQLEQTESALAAARAQEQQAAANLRAAKELLSYGEIRSPIDGIVTRRTIDPGSLAGPGQPILTIEDPRDLELSVPVPADKARTLRPGQTATVTVEALDRTIEARIRAIVGADDPATRTATVKLDLPKDAALRPGQFAHASFAAFAEEGLAVPEAALVTHGQMDGVFVVEEGEARLRWIQVGRRAGAMAEVLAGLHPGELVVSPVPPDLRDETPVEVQR